MSAERVDDITLCDLCRVPLTEFDTCTGCGVWHGDPCGRRSYHVDQCPEIEGSAN